MSNFLFQTPWRLFLSRGPMSAGEGSSGGQDPENDSDDIEIRGILNYFVQLYKKKNFFQYFFFYEYQFLFTRKYYIPTLHNHLLPLEEFFLNVPFFQQIIT